MHPLEKFEYCPKCGSHHFVESGATSKKCENCGFEYFMNASSANVAIIKNAKGDRKSTRLNSSHVALSRMPSSA